RVRHSPGEPNNPSTFHANSWVNSKPWIRPCCSSGVRGRVAARSTAAVSVSIALTKLLKRCFHRTSCIVNPLTGGILAKPSGFIDKTRFFASPIVLHLVYCTNGNEANQFVYCARACLCSPSSIAKRVADRADAYVQPQLRCKSLDSSKLARLRPP